MPKASHGHFETSWTPPALAFIDRVLESDQLSEAQEMETGILRSRALLAKTMNISVESAMGPIENSRKKIAEGTRLRLYRQSSDRANRDGFPSFKGLARLP